MNSLPWKNSVPFPQKIEQHLFDENVPLFSFLLPTRGRPDLVKRLFQSIVDTTENQNSIEIILGVDDDDLESQAIVDPRLNIKMTVLPRGLTMGQLNRACFDASTGKYVVIANDDIILRTNAWDRIVINAFAMYPDDIALVHVNDLLFREKLCTFPIVSRMSILEIGLCPPGYKRYKIDDHVYDIYSLLAYLGHKRILYLPEVIFEHDNHDNALIEASNAHIFKSQDQKTYIPKQGIIEEDHQLFLRTFNQRKRAAIALAKLIDEGHYKATSRQYQSSLYWNHPATKTQVYHNLVMRISEPYGYRRKDFIKELQIAPGSPLMSKRVTVAVVSADIQNQFAQECIARIKKYTKNYSLIILDNNRGYDFNHPREMNKVLSIVDTDYLVLMDDDVYVEPDWLEGLMRCMDETTGVVVPVHKDAAGQVNFTGMYMAGDGTGNHEHLMDIPAEPREVQAVCSALLLIDLKKCGHIFMDEKYQKYFFDPVYTFEIWGAGFKVICTPEVTVTHLGGATMIRGTEEASGLWQRDNFVISGDWIETARYEKLCALWQKYPALKTLVRIPQEINQLIMNLINISNQEFEEKISELLVDCKPYPLFTSLLFNRCNQVVSELINLGHSEKAGTVLSVVRLMQASDPAKFSDMPVLLQEYKGFNIVLYADRFFGLGRRIGRLALRQIALNKPHEFIYNHDYVVGDSLKDIFPKVDRLVDSIQPITDGQISINSKELSQTYLVSAIVSTYNAERFMRACLDDLENQTIRDRLEIIVIDSGSLQNEKAIVKEFQRKFNNIIFQRTARENSHVAFNRAIALAHGQYVTMANTDDRHHPDAFRRMVEVFETHPAVGVVYFDSAITQTPNTTLEHGPITGRFRWPDFDRELLFKVCYVGPQAMWRREMNEKFGGFDAQFFSAGDYELWLRLSDKTHFFHMPQILGLYYESPASNEHKDPSLSIRESEQARIRYWKAEDGPRPAPGGMFLERYAAIPDAGTAERFPLVSVIIPTYNRPGELRAALDSVIQQTYPNLEIVLVNDAGEDVSHLVQEASKKVKIRCEVHTQNQGAGAARNTGMRMAQGKYVAFLDDDDTYRPEHLFMLVAELEHDLEIVAAYADGLQITVDPARKKARQVDKKVVFSTDYSKDELLVHNYIPMLTIIFRRSALEKAGYFDTGLSALEDWEWLIRLSRVGPFTHLPVVTSEYLVRQGGSRNWLQPEQIQALYQGIYQSTRKWSREETRQRQSEFYAKMTGRDLMADLPGLFAETSVDKPIELDPISASLASSSPAGQAAETLELLLNAEDLLAALEQHQDRLDADLLALVRENARGVRAEGDTQLAEGLDDLAEYIEHLLEPDVHG